MDINLYRVNLNLLVALNVLLQEKSVTKAADKLFMTQAAMSKNLASLREIFKDELLIREKNYMVLTAYAERLQTKLQPLIEEIRSFIENGQRFEQSTSRRNFKIGMSDYVTSLVLPKLQAHLAKIAPSICLSIVTIDHLSDPSVFEQGEFDLAIGKDFGGNAIVNRHLLFKDKGICIVGNKHPLARQKKISLQDYLAYNHIAVLRSNDPNRPRMIDNFLAEMAVQREVIIELPYMEPILQIVSQSKELIGSLPQKIATHYQKHYQFTTFPLPFDLKPMEYYLLWNHRFDNDLGHTWLREQIKKLFIG